ncbi:MULTISPECIES: flagellar basal body rod protein FlgC [Cupriavidus]|jgi:flagellar basal-body rod protein FlgC|uniref:Flagellar basal-body rod protein FlgC n=1 Tax=Cupriavidus oxalaticus TaxID=96344 RepID=A0A375GE09_9BURK|nr:MULTISPECIES: flagellar basal body rod protein FlgC [Cupriavidus]MBF6988345.1 flagellar basal body rod protein FlgC [Cupriavidus sp. IK-TO18]MBP0621130.1 flagellar basal body rod protein FlgC [Cupriavidus sp. LEh25]MBP0636676.1 flagellar basal body rod protein FlgC [Cupriavidus sp. AcVe19-6a]MDK2657799.1 flagellar basal body rod protein FlgC [Cupriavidus sp. LEh21]QBY50953.1 flagellar basal body rod protein FlgC [Cupriavidus oxalaticus]
MPAMNIFDVAGSAMAAQSQRMNVTASNLANADSVVSPDGQAYRAKQVVFGMAPTPGQSDVGGVQVAGISEDPSPPRMVHNPTHPMANAQGYVVMPNVNPVEEMVNMISASRSYQANVEVLNSAKNMMLKTLTIGQ